MVIVVGVAIVEGEFKPTRTLEDVVVFRVLVALAYNVHWLELDSVAQVGLARPCGLAFVSIEACVFANNLLFVGMQVGCHINHFLVSGFVFLKLIDESKNAPNNLRSL